MEIQELSKLCVTIFLNSMMARGKLILKSIILPNNRTDSERKIKPIKTLSEYGQQFKKKVFSGFQG